MYMNCHPYPLFCYKILAIFILQHIRHPSSLTVKRTQPSPANPARRRLFSGSHSWKSIRIDCLLFTIRSVTEMAEVNESPIFNKIKNSRNLGPPDVTYENSFEKTSLLLSIQIRSVHPWISLYAPKFVGSSPNLQNSRRLWPKFHQIRKIDVLGASNDG